MMDKTRYVRFDFFTPTISSYEIVEQEKKQKDSERKKKVKNVKRLVTDHNHGTTPSNQFPV